jgi:hypothetical protein
MKKQKTNESKTKEDNKDGEKNLSLRDFYLSIWDERSDEQEDGICFETGIHLSGYRFRGLSTCYHHVLEKGKGSYPQYTFTRANVLILHPDIHQKVGKSIESCPKIKKYREYLLSLHEQDKLTEDLDYDECIKNAILEQK